MSSAIKQIPGAVQGVHRAGLVPSLALARGVHVSSQSTKESTSGPPTPPEEMDAEKKVKVGVNAPRSAGEFASEASHAASGLAESISETVKATATAIKRSLGMTDEKPMSKPEIHGGAGKMQHAPPGSMDGGPAKDRAHAEAKYQEIMDAEKPHFPKGEESVNEMFPDMAEAAQLQNVGGGTTHKDVKLDENLHQKGP